MTEQQVSKSRKRAIIYLRARTVGGSGRDVDAQLQRQREACEHIANQQDTAVTHEYKAIGGVRDGHVRAIVSDMLNLAAEARADYIITTAFDRLFRDPANTDRELMRAIRASGAVLLCGNTWDIAVPMGPSDDALAEAHPLFLARRRA